MINLLLFFNDDKLKSHVATLKGNFTVVTPNPTLADVNRIKYDSRQDFNVLTISRFIKDYAELLFDDEVFENLKRKSELNLILGSLYKIMNPNSKYELFKKSFQLLTDFRAFSLNEEVLKSILENYDPEVARSVLWFHRTMNELNLIDEHKSYFLISQRLREEELPVTFENERNIIFTGFDFLTPAQLDMIQALSIRNNIYVPFYKNAYDKSKDFDWIKWITRFDSKISIIDGKESESSTTEMTTFTKNSLGKTLSNFENIDNLILCSSNIEQNMVNEIPFDNLKFKVPIEILSKEISFIEDSLLEMTMKNSIELNDFETWYNKQVEQAILDKNFKLIKALQLLMEIYNEWKDLSIENKIITSFENKLFLESLKLNTPRNSLISEHKGNISVESLKGIEKVQKDEKNVFCVTSDYSPIKSSVADYSEDVQKYLASIGPIRRSEFEFEILKAKLVEKLKCKNSILLIEDKLTTEDAGWSSILKDLNIEKVKLNDDKSVKRDFESFLNKNISHDLNYYSASRLQTFLDCPQKYWLNYVVKRSKRVTLPNELMPMELGILEHDVIDSFMNQYEKYSAAKLKELILYKLKSFKNISNEKLLKLYEIEIMSYTSKIIQDLFELQSELKVSFEFEKDLKNNVNKAIGSIDLYGQGKEIGLILDFKRSASSIPSQSSLFNFEKIQLWFYLNQTNLFDPDFVKRDFVWGYINLSEPEKSLLFTNSLDCKKRMEALSTESFKKIILIKDEIAKLKTNYAQFENEIIASIKNEKNFSPNPKEEAVCSFCDLNKVCTKGILDE